MQNCVPSSSKNVPLKNTFYTLVSLALGLGLCTTLIVRLNIRTEDWGQILKGTSGFWIFTVTLLTASLWGAGARKWQIWARLSGHEEKFDFFLTHFSWQNWIGQFVPPSLSIILGRSWAMRHSAGGWVSGVKNGFYDQIIEFLFLVALIPAAWPLLQKPDENLFAFFTLAVLLSSLVFFVLLCFCARKDAQKKRNWAAILFWSEVRVILTILRLVAGLWALGLSINPVAAAAATPLVALLALIPLTPGNLGVAEWGWVAALSIAQTNAVDAALYAIGFRLLLVPVQSILLAVILYVSSPCARQWPCPSRQKKPRDRRAFPTDPS